MRFSTKKEGEKQEGVWAANGLRLAAQWKDRKERKSRLESCSWLKETKDDSAPLIMMWCFEVVYT